MQTTIETEGQVLAIDANDNYVAIAHRPLDANKLANKEQTLAMLNSLTFYSELNVDGEESEFKLITWPIPFPLV